MKNSGFTLLEMLITLGILGLVIVGVYRLAGDLLVDNFYIQQKALAESEGRSALKTMIGELRGASQSNTGVFPLESASSTGVVFYADTDGDNLFERIRYTAVAAELKRGVIVPSGSPLSYDPADETEKTLTSRLATTTVFSFFDKNYAGTSSPLVEPVSLNDVRLVNIDLLLDIDDRLATNPFELSGWATLRNLKDNL
ncbi:MAG: hypothetical protein COV09_00640 [Candidatus Vogelbacteria bacterium CG10_big_fil_rev_8_21_14_0_10_50_13]|uniref:Type II secretion system protein J n=1 Tax=Candidatus Vogelbacteria bacterium CG10_big_fil_rev_8_21_14_0_10_50_13 TaxID=1975044 RepID=A0A2H0RGB8_9BACT|nr:MAG: hypothetical protein COV09_00640 [Candidatus Vogelbacteria bacterium CG10_big_fil_rev_8_21_14_0_10_50_13]